MTGKKEILLFAGSLAVCLLIGELGARILLPKPFRADRSAIIEAEEIRKPANRKTFASLHRADPEIGWVLNPDSIQYRNRLVDSKGVLQYDVMYSVAGSRRKTANQPHDGPELIAAGCSFTFGHGLNDQDTWPWLLQEKLPDRQVINSGCMGYGTDQALMAAEREVHKHTGPPPAVVLGFADFQIERNRCTQGWLVTVYPFSKPLFAMQGGQPVYQHQVKFWDGGFLAQHSNLFGALTNTFANRANHIPSHDEARDLTAALITEYGRRFREQGVRFAVVVLPYFRDNGPQARADRQSILAKLHDAGIPVLVADFPQDGNRGLKAEEFLVSPIDRHPNRAYSLLLTSQLQPFLVSAGILPQ